VAAVIVVWEVVDAVVEDAARYVPVLVAAPVVVVVVPPEHSPSRA
jgi:hypothetical protein